VGQQLRILKEVQKQRLTGQSTGRNDILRLGYELLWTDGMEHREMTGADGSTAL